MNRTARCCMHDPREPYPGPCTCDCHGLALPEDPDAPIDMLSPLPAIVAVLEYSLGYCDHHPGVNLPELLREALTDIGLRHGSERLIEHRPGSWEADLVRQLDSSELYRG